MMSNSFLAGYLFNYELTFYSYFTFSFSVGHTVPNLDDVGLAFRDMGINLPDLEEYIRNVDSIPCVYEIPKYPIPRDSHLNFLKPGSREVVTRPVHVHEHLPPMRPEMEGELSHL